MVMITNVIELHIKDIHNNRLYLDNCIIMYIVSYHNSLIVCIFTYMICISMSTVIIFNLVYICIRITYIMT